MKHSTLLTFFVSTALLFCGCTGYRLGSAVPEELRTIHVPAFENQTEYPMVGAIAAQQFLDCLIEEGVFTPSSYDDARLRMQAIVKSCATDAVRYDRNELVIPNEYYVTLTVEVHVFDAQTGETYIDGKSINATDTMLTRNQYQTGIQDVLPRLARRLARNLVDELNSIEPNADKPRPLMKPAKATTETVEAEESAEIVADVTEEESEAEAPAEEPVAEVEAELPAEAEAPAEEPAAEVEAELPAEAEAPAEEVVADDEAMAEAPAEEAPAQVETQE